MIDVSIIIVNYNTMNLVRDCLSSIVENTKEIKYEIIVSDNGSIDGSVEMIKRKFPQVILIENNRNLGFGAANNVATKIAKGKYVFYLNSDTILLNNAVKMFFDYWESREEYNIGVLGAQLLDCNYYPTKSWAKYPTPIKVLKSLLHMYLAPELKKKTPLKINDIPNEGMVVDGYITGADLFLKNDANALFDERFFMYAEETDLEYNHFKLKDKKCIIVPNVQIVHFEGGSDKSETVSTYDFGKKSNIYLWLSNIKYLRKNYPKSNITIFVIKKILLYIWKQKKYNNRTNEYLEELKNI